MRGQITSIKRLKGFGFIRADEESDDRMFHANETPTFDSLEEGDEVEFEPYTLRGKGQRAKRVHKVQP